MTVFKMGTNLKNFITSLNANFSELLNRSNIYYKTLYSGSAGIPSKDSGNTSTITLSDNITNYDGVIIQREGSSCWQTVQTISVNTVFKVMNCESDFEFMEGCNLYMCNAKVTSSNKLQLSNNVYAGIKTTAAGRYLTSFTDRPITKVIGIKFN